MNTAVVEKVKSVASLFEDAAPVCGFCFEGHRSCGKPEEVRQFFKSL